MFKIDQLSIQKDHRHLFSDVSFVLPDTGFCSLWTKEQAEQEALSYVLSGIRPCSAGTICCNHVKINKDLEQEASFCYRNTMVAHWFEDFLFIPQATMKQNVMLEETFEQEQFDALVKQWHLEDCVDKSIENLTFKQQIYTYITRVMIRKYKVLLFYPGSTPYSKEELQAIYHVLKKCSQYILVIVVGDQDCYSYADRKIEFEHGYILSDDIHEQYKETKDRLPAPRKALKLFGISFPRLTKKYQ